MDQVISGLTLSKRVWLANFITRNNALPPGERVKRDKIPAALNKQFPGTGFTLSKLFHLYTHYKGIGNFIAQTKEEDRRAQAAEASKAKAPVNAKQAPVKSAPRSGIEKPPKAVAPQHQPLSTLPLPPSSPPKLRKRIETNVKELRMPTTKTRPTPIDDILKGFNLEKAERALENAPRYRPDQITGELAGFVAIEMGRYTEDSYAYWRTVFRRPTAYAAYMVNAQRKTESDPILDARIIEDAIGRESRTKDWLLGKGEFIELFSTPAAVADEVSRRLPEFLP